MERLLEDSVGLEEKAYIRRIVTAIFAAGSISWLLHHQHNRSGKRNVFIFFDELLL